MTGHESAECSHPLGAVVRGSGGFSCLGLGSRSLRNSDSAGVNQSSEQEERQTAKFPFHLEKSMLNLSVIRISQRNS